MKEGAIVLMDCLGFKGIWQRAEPDRVLQQFEAIRERASQVVNEGIFHAHRMLGFSLQISFLSDTVAIGVSAPAVQNLSSNDKGRLIHLACIAAQKIAVDFLNMTPPLTVRGAASFGLFELSDRFLIGPAVDEAAELHEMADGAFLWIPPQYIGFIVEMRVAVAQTLQRNEGTQQLLDLLVAIAHTYGGPVEAATFKERLERLPTQKLGEVSHILREMLCDPENDWNLVRYIVPLKGRGGLECLVVGPNVPINYPVMRKQYESAMNGTSLDVVIKRQNTLRFLDYAHNKHVKGQQKWAEKVQVLNKAILS